MRKWKYVEQENGCWIWVGAKKGNGYRNSWINGKHVPAHRAVYTALVGEIELGMVLHHKCNNKLCVNPAHIEVTTNARNVRYACYGSKTLDREISVRELRRRVSAGESAASVGMSLGFTARRAQKIARFEDWPE